MAKSLRSCGRTNCGCAGDAEIVKAIGNAASDTRIEATANKLNDWGSERASIIWPAVITVRFMAV